MDDYRSIVTDDDIRAVWGNANFGHDNKRLVVDDALLHVACGYANGHTAECIITELELITSRKHITQKGQQYAYSRFKTMLMKESR